MFLISEKNPADEKGETPMHLAAQINRLEICQLIMDNLINKNPSDGNILKYTTVKDLPKD